MNERSAGADDLIVREVAPSVSAIPAALVAEADHAAAVAVVEDRG